MAQKILDIWKNYYTSGKIFVFLEKLWYVQKIFLYIWENFW
jgi:hypothetical protein